MKSYSCEYFNNIMQCVWNCYL